ncbi:MAG: glutathione synthase [Gammaproteobacteria bacterium]
MTINLGVIMDPIEQINPKKDTTLALLHAAQIRGWNIHYMEMRDLRLRDGVAEANVREIEVEMSLENWFQFVNEPKSIELGSLDVILMRKDPPFDTEYIFSTYILERAEHAGALVVNRPQSLRDANEKLFTAWFPQVCTPTLVTRDHREIRAFAAEFEDIIIKPLDGMGGSSIFRVTKGDGNASVIYETLTDHEARYCMVQKYLPEIIDGDKRILLVDGEPVPYALARIPAIGELRGNLAAGGSGVGRALTERDQEICEIVGPTLVAKGLIFVGLDVIGDHLTEINVTSPTCVRELNEQFDLDIGAKLMDAIERRLK